MMSGASLGVGVRSPRRITGVVRSPMASPKKTSRLRDSSGCESGRLLAGTPGGFNSRITTSSCTISVGLLVRWP